MLVEEKSSLPLQNLGWSIVTNDLLGSVPRMWRYHLPLPVIRSQLILNKWQSYLIIILEGLLVTFQLVRVSSTNLSLVPREGA